MPVRMSEEEAIRRGILKPLEPQVHVRWLTVPGPERIVYKTNMIAVAAAAILFWVFGFIMGHP